MSSYFAKLPLVCLFALLGGCASMPAPPYSGGGAGVPASLRMDLYKQYCVNDLSAGTAQINKQAVAYQDLEGYFRAGGDAQAADMVKGGTLACLAAKSLGAVAATAAIVPLLKMDLDARSGGGAVAMLGPGAIVVAGGPLFLLGDHMLDPRFFRRAMQHFNRYLAQDLQLPQMERALDALGQARSATQPAEAVTAYLAYLSVVPEDTLAWEHAGDAYLKLGRKADALRCYCWAMPDPVAEDYYQKRLAALGRREF